MGWSCSAAAGRVVDSWIAFCRESLNSSNTYVDAGKVCFFEESRVEHEDGSITGNVHVMVGVTAEEYRRNEFGEFRARRVGSFRIAGDGSIVRAPKVLVEAWRRAAGDGGSHV